MQQTILLLIAAGGVVFGVLAIVDTLHAAWARRRDAKGVQDKVLAPQSSVYGDRPASARRSGAKTEHLDPVRVQHLIVELHRTRSILLGWLSVLEAFALGDAWRATALRAELGDINTCDISLVGDANVIATYQITVDMLRNQAGRGLPADVASEMASIRVRLLTALAEQERRLNHGERPIIAEPLVHLDLWGPPRPITEVTIRPPTPTSQPLLGDSSTSSPAQSRSTGAAVAAATASSPSTKKRPSLSRQRLSFSLRTSFSRSLSLLTITVPNPATRRGSRRRRAAERGRRDSARARAQSRCHPVRARWR